MGLPIPSDTTTTTTSTTAATTDSSSPQGQGHNELEAVPPRLMAFWRFFRDHIAGLARYSLTVRDLLAWAGFVMTTAPRLGVCGDRAGSVCVLAFCVQQHASCDILFEGKL
jgi:hypothetical protein